MIDRRPAAIARCLGVADVLAGVKFARDNGLPLSIKGGGHNIAGLAVCDGGLMLDMSLMRGVWVDPAARLARAQAGCLLGDLDRETQVHGLAAVLGFVSNTGIAGLTLGGGFGYLSRRFGWTCDNVTAMDLVTADGRVVRASERENADLLWGLRGGGGNFGVVTGFEYTLYPVGPEIVGGAIAWRAEEAAEVLAHVSQARRRGATRADDGGAHASRAARPVAARRRSTASRSSRCSCAIRGRLRTASGCSRPSRRSGCRSATPSSGGPTSHSRTSSMPPSRRAGATTGSRNIWRRSRPDLLSAVIAHAGRIVSPHSAVVLFAIDGALNRLPGDHSAAGNRDARMVLNITASWERAADDGANIEWARTAWRDMRRFSTGGTYVNFLTEDEGDDRTRAAYGANHARLSALKSRVGPGQSVPREQEHRTAAVDEFRPRSRRAVAALSRMPRGPDVLGVDHDA